MEIERKFLTKELPLSLQGNHAGVSLLFPDHPHPPEQRRLYPDGEGEGASGARGI